MHALCRGRYSIQVMQGSSAKFAKMNKSLECSLPLYILKYKQVSPWSPRLCSLRTEDSRSIKHKFDHLKHQRISSPEPEKEFASPWEELCKWKICARGSQGQWGLQQAKEEGTRKITVSLLSQLVFGIQFRKSLTLFESKALQLTLLSLSQNTGCGLVRPPPFQQWKFS